MPRTKPAGFVTVAASAELVRWIHWIAVPVASTSETAIEAMPISAPLNGIRLPMPMISANAMPGTRAISQAFSRNHPELSSVLLRRARQPFISDSSSSEIERRLR